MGLDVGEIGMGLDLGLDLRLFAARSATRMASAAAVKGGPDAVDACIRSLEEERRKIEVFRRELPLCVRLLADVIEELKEESAKTGGDAVDVDGDKRKWMSTAQLWVDNEAARSDESDKEQQSDEVASPEPRILGGAPMPSRTVAAVAPPPPPPPPSSFFRTGDKVAGTVGLPGLPVPAAGDEHRHQNEAARFAATMPPSGPALISSLHVVQQQQQQQSRKARRCWSPELHRKFVAALHQLGGPQVATPKQIREVMQVDGLTNDEVKSHLQKYRLHNRRSPGATPVTQHLQFSGSGSGVGASAPSVGGDSSSGGDEDDD